jgi:RNA polymerase sigma factor FliA
MLHTMIDHDQLTYNRAPTAVRVDEVVRAHSAMVRRIAWHVHSRMSTAIDVEDLIQIGMIALVEASRVFEDRGVAFAPYASTRVRGAMIDELRRDARMARSGMAKRREISQIRARLENQFNRPATDAEMAEAMRLSPRDYQTALASTHSIRLDSIDEVYSDHSAWFADAGLGADSQIEESERRAILAQSIGKLNEREAMVLQLYFVEEMNLDEIGETLGVGAARVCQIKKAALERLRHMLGGNEM